MAHLRCFMFLGKFIQLASWHVCGGEMAHGFTCGERTLAFFKGTWTEEESEGQSFCRPAPPTRT